MGIMVLLLLVGCSVDCEDCVRVCDKTVEWAGAAKDKAAQIADDIKDKNDTLKCCYPYTCSQAANNTEPCTCMYVTCNI